MAIGWDDDDKLLATLAGDLLQFADYADEDPRKNSWGDVMRLRASQLTNFRIERLKKLSADKAG